MYFTERGNLKTAVRENLHNQVANHYLEDFVKQPNGQYTIDLMTESGKTIKAVIDLSITTRENFEKKGPKGKEPVEEINVATLFD